jgi:hypothetical protein
MMFLLQVAGTADALRQIQAKLHTDFVVVRFPFFLLLRWQYPFGSGYRPRSEVVSSRPGVLGHTRLCHEAPLTQRRYDALMMRRARHLLATAPQ